MTGITPVLITGMKHSGKSTAGRMVADALSADFIDLDDLIEELFSADSGTRLSVREIYKEGRDIFREYETKAANELAGKGGIFTVAAGGGICDNSPACESLREFTWVYIDEEPALLFERIIGGGIPAFLSSGDPFTEFQKLYNHRTELYDKLCNIKIIAGGRTPPEISAEIIDKLTEAGYGRK